MKVTRGKHVSRFLVGAVCAAIGLYADYGAKKSDQAFLQMAVWTLFLLLMCAVEFRGNVIGRSLNRSVMRYVAIILLALHFVFLYAIRDRFPFQSSLSILLLSPLEGLGLLFLYLKVGIIADPKGPLAMTRREQKKAEKRRTCWNNLLKKPQGSGSDER